MDAFGHVKVVVVASGCIEMVVRLEMVVVTVVVHRCVVVPVHYA